MPIGFSTRPWLVTNCQLVCPTRLSHHRCPHYPLPASFFRSRRPFRNKRTDPSPSVVACVFNRVVVTQHSVQFCCRAERNTNLIKIRQRRETTTAGIETIGINLRRNALTSSQKWALPRRRPYVPRAYDSCSPLPPPFVSPIIEPSRASGESIFERTNDRSIESKDRGGSGDSIERITRCQGACYRVCGPADPLVHNKSIIAR